MSSSHFGELGMGEGRSGSSSSRKGKKSGSDKPKQPQRGLGVAQLEKIRLHSQMAAGYVPPPLHHHHHHPPFRNKEDDVFELGFASSPSSSAYAATPSPLFSLHPNTMMGFGEANQRIDVRHGEFRPSSSASSSSYLNHNSGYMHQHSAHQPVTLPLLQQTMEDSAQKKRRHDRSYSTGSMSENSDSSDNQELDLDLKLSI